MGLRKNLLFGLVAGAAGTAAMNGYWKALAKAKPSLAESGEGEEPATVRVARRVFRKAGIKSPSSDARALGGQAVHWGYGSGWGLAAGLSRSAGVPLTWGGGQLFGAGLWALGDLWMLYQLGLARHPREYPKQLLATSLGAHLAYGFGVWAAMEGLEAMAGGKKKHYRRAA